MIKNIKLLFYFFPVIIAFIMPFGNALSSPLIALWFLTSFFCVKDIFIKANLKNKWFLAIIAFFLLTLISNYLFFNVKDPISSIEVKLSFLMFPLLFFLFSINLAVARRVIAAFVSGCLFACMICIGRAFMYLFQGDSSYFSYSNFSFFMHSAYFAMYLNLAVLFIILFYFKWFKANPAYIYFAGAMLAVFVVCIMLCASKIGIISLFILIPFTVVLEFRSRIRLKHYLLAGLALLVTSVSIYALVPQVFDRLRSVSVVTETSIDKTATESSTVRVLIWKECTEIISNHMITGVGVSRTNDTLYKSYEEHGLTGAFGKKLNAHNQYFQTFIGLGVFGALNLFVLTIGLVIHGFRTKNNLLVFFGLLVSVNFLVESMLQTSAGNVFYVFFMCFLLMFHQNKLADETAQ
jgi:O-antigen ligase